MIHITKRKLFQKTDLVIVAAALSAALLLRLVSGRTGNGEDCRVIYNGGAVAAVSLNGDGEFTVKEAPGMLFLVKDGAVAASASDCPDKTCVNMGFISRPWQKIVCLPNKIVVDITASEANNGEPDMVAR